MRSLARTVSVETPKRSDRVPAKIAISPKMTTMPKQMIATGSLRSRSNAIRNGDLPAISWGTSGSPADGDSGGASEAEGNGSCVKPAMQDLSGSSQNPPESNAKAAASQRSEEHPSELQ